jgi:hypothetical protein
MCWDKCVSKPGKDLSDSEKNVRIMTIRPCAPAHLQECYRMALLAKHLQTANSNTSSPLMSLLSERPAFACPRHRRQVLQHRHVHIPLPVFSLFPSSSSSSLSCVPQYLTCLPPSFLSLPPLPCCQCVANCSERFLDTSVGPIPFSFSLPPSLPPLPRSLHPPSFLTRIPSPRSDSI